MTRTAADISRRELLRGRFLRSVIGSIAPRDDVVLKTPVERTNPTPPPSPGGGCIPVLRPPGALPEPEFLARCTRCDACIEACPHDAIVHAPARMRSAAGTPVIDPIQQPCWLCEDRPCATACEPGAIRLDDPPAMGRAMISTPNCMAYSGTGCSVCVEQCPVDDAISMVNGKPVISADACTGCGVCQYVCPAPRNAVIIMPRLIKEAS